MEFLVRMESLWPADGDAARLNEHLEHDSARVSELAESGVVSRLWRIPGNRANWGLWSASDASELHAALSSLQLFPYLEIEVVTLGTYPLDPGLKTR